MPKNDFEADAIQGEIDARKGKWSPPDSNLKRIVTNEEGNAEYDKRRAVYERSWDETKREKK